MIKKIEVFRLEKNEGYCSIEYIPDLAVIEISGDCELMQEEIEQFRAATTASDAVNKSGVNRFVFFFPNLTTDLAFRLAGSLESTIFKAAFIVHSDVFPAFEINVLWVICKHHQVEIAYMKALKLVGRFEVASLLRDDNASYEFTKVEQARESKDSDESL